MMINDATFTSNYDDVTKLTMSNYDWAATMVLKFFINAIAKPHEKRLTTVSCTF